MDQTLDAARLYLTLEGKQTAHNLITSVVFWGHRRLEHLEREVKLSCLGVEQRCTRKKELRALTESQENLRLAVAIARAAPAQHSRPGAAVRWLFFFFGKPNKLQFETRGQLQETEDEAKSKRAESSSLDRFA